MNAKSLARKTRNILSHKNRDWFSNENQGKHFMNRFGLFKISSEDVALDEKCLSTKSQGKSTFAMKIKTKSKDIQSSTSLRAPEDIRVWL
jgi:hypothetical protein